ncbi:MAG: putative PEP-binding protein, partial [Balneolaceae bacterium]|nr:putative PEP-binding protein [Balneolaceae bacterium]
ETGNLPVTIRLFDAGGDKFFSLGSRENNPFLGWRGIRMLLDEQDLLRDQLTALLRIAGRYPGRMRILVPMVTNIEEVLAVKEMLLGIQGRLVEEGVPVDEEVQLGIMIEVPSVALQAPQFAPLVDFFSIGSNDLTQYTLAVDRSNELISEMYRQNHPAVWQLIRYSVEAAADADIAISVCGEMAADPDCASCLLGLGINDLSMSPVNIPDVKAQLIQREYSEYRELAERVLAAGTEDEVSTIFREWKQDKDHG